MESNKLSVGRTDHFIVCDNPACSFHQEIEYDEIESWVDKPCPECGINLLTREDYDGTKAAQKLIKTFTEMTEEQRADLAEKTGIVVIPTQEPQTIWVGSHHGEICITNRNPIENKLDIN